MRILIVLTYYRPHTSGLTIYAERLAKAFVRRGHQVTVLTSQFDETTPREEVVDGVRIVRAPVIFRISKGVVMPAFGFMANKLVREHDYIQLHLPQFDAAGVALRGRLLKKPTVVTYHCDLLMPKGALPWIANQAINLMNRLTAMFAHRFVAYTKDYAEHSPYLQPNLNKLHVIPPPVELPQVMKSEIDKFKKENNPDGNWPVIGMASRFATEKGVEILLQAFPDILKEFPNAMIHFAGSYLNIMGEEHYFDRLIPQIRDLEAKGQWKFLGNLDPQQISAFYPNLDVLTMPSLNSTEAFGLVQIEAMMNSVPCVASNLPGVRRPTRIHDMGEVVPIGDASGLAEGIIKVLKNPQDYRTSPTEIKARYIPENIAEEYEKLFREIEQEIK